MTKNLVNTEIVQHKNPMECDVCNKFFDEVWTIDVDGIDANWCIMCLAHRFGTSQALELQMAPDSEYAKIW